MTRSPRADAAVRLRLARGVTATWWYTVSTVIFLEVFLVLIWTGALAERGADIGVAVTVGASGLVWAAATVMLLLDYRQRTEAAPWARAGRLIAPLAVSVAFGVVAGLLSGTWVMAALPFAQALVLVNWPSGVRLRLTIAVTVLLGALWFIDTSRLSPAQDSGWWLFGFYSVVLPALSVASLWWWDVLATIDRARASEARLAATQERLRVATDVHDLQGHHLQVIALQLELAERLAAADPAASLDQLRAARRSVDEARQGTRDLATRYREVPLTDEIANAVDLLRAAGIEADATVDAGTEDAPAAVLAPVIRETTTNVLRHGGGRWARLSLTRRAGVWRYEITNDPGDVADDGGGGSGIDGIRRRVGEAGGTVEVREERQAFSIVSSMPDAEVGR
ncbi:histidine kinase [Microbacterium aoyamense]|uniref:Histidine kinase n=1 Tax=Microbacterium aoyamense TaxID=344166 RepID=A0ABP5B550_9MICO|nr:histidine kinase [Microbacterium aoyamense]